MECLKKNHRVRSPIITRYMICDINTSFNNIFYDFLPLPLLLLITMITIGQKHDYGYECSLCHSGLINDKNEGTN